MKTIENRVKGLLLAGLLMSGQLAAQDIPAVTGWQQRVTLSTPVSGLVARVNVSPGVEVKRGALMLELDQRKFQARLAAAEARREAAAQLSSESKRELDRALELYDRTMLSDHELKLAEIEATTSNAAFREAEARLTDARLQREYSRIAAPFDGLVTEVLVQPGEAVVNRLQAAPLLTLVDHTRMQALAQADERTLSKLSVGDKVRIGVGGEWLEGEISVLGFEPVSASGSAAAYRLAASFKPASGSRLRAGESVVIRLPDE